MEIMLFAPCTTLLSGLSVGFAFGFLLRKAYVTRFDTIVNQLLLRDFTVMKVIMTTIAFGSVGIYTLHALHPEYEFMISNTTLLSAAIGGALFGIGMATMGYCPGTGIGALADGARDMWFGLLGMIAGAAMYAEVVPWIIAYIKPVADMNTITLPELLGISPWIFIAAIFCMLGGLFMWDR